MGQLVHVSMDVPPPVVTSTSEQPRPPFETFNHVNNLPTQLDGPVVSCVIPYTTQFVE